MNIYVKKECFQLTAKGSGHVLLVAFQSNFKTNWDLGNLWRTLLY